MIKGWFGAAKPHPGWLVSLGWGFLTPELRLTEDGPGKKSQLEGEKGTAWWEVPGGPSHAQEVAQRSNHQVQAQLQAGLAEYHCPKLTPWVPRGVRLSLPCPPHRKKSATGTSPVPSCLPLCPKHATRSMSTERTGKVSSRWCSAVTVQGTLGTA